MKRVIVIAGPSGSGKSTVANLVAKRLGLKSVDSGQIFRKMGLEHGMDVITFGVYAGKHKALEREFDARVAAMVKKSSGAVMQGRLAAWTCLGFDIAAKKIWLTASAKVRAERIARREKIPFKKAYADLCRRDRENVIRYRKTYGIDFDDMSVYDATIDTDHLNIKLAVEAILKCLPKVWLLKGDVPLMKRPLKMKK
ncbi:MAG: cytidylate kinase family protein [Patescibacteria group bacterium]|nr:cytidylate kinase family protein [Patescibacteria group bacterium]